MNSTRRSFLKKSGMLSAALLAVPSLGIPGLGCSRNRDDQSPDPETETLPFGIQLWTLRDVFPENPRGVLEQLASFGYRQIELFEGPQGMFWGYSPTEMKQIIDDLGMELVASHCNIQEGFERKADQAAEAGLKYLICPWIGGQDTLDDYRRFADMFNESGRICRERGFRFAYHNHEYTFQKLDGVYPQDLLMQETDPELVEYELDMYWVAAAGEDNKEWIEKYPGRFTLSHVKDRADVPADQMRASTTLGTGVINYPEILKKARENGMNYFFVEQEEYENTTPVDAARDGAAYMKGLDMFE